MSDTKPECVCPFLVRNPYACPKCWPNKGSDMEKLQFSNAVKKERELVEANEKKKENY